MRHHIVKPAAQGTRVSLSTYDSSPASVETSRTALTIGELSPANVARRTCSDAKRNAKQPFPRVQIRLGRGRNGLSRVSEAFRDWNSLMSPMHRNGVMKHPGRNRFAFSVRLTSRT